MQNEVEPVVCTHIIASDDVPACLKVLCHCSVTTYRYDIMLMCWDQLPQKRPTFTELRAKFDAMLLADKNEHYIDLRFDETKLYYQLVATSSTEKTTDGLQSILTPSSSIHPNMEKEVIVSPGRLSSVSALLLASPKSCFSNSADHVNSKLCVASGLGHTEGGEEDQTYRNTGRPVSMYLPHEADKRERENPYVDEPSKMAAMTLGTSKSEGLPAHWRSDGAINSNQVENIELKTRDPILKDRNGPEILITVSSDD